MGIRGRRNRHPGGRFSLEFAYKLEARFAAGQSREQIAKDLGVGVDTLKEYISSARFKLERDLPGAGARQATNVVGPGKKAGAQSASAIRKQSEQILKEYARRGRCKRCSSPLVDGACFGCAQGAAYAQMAGRSG